MQPTIQRRRIVNLIDLVQEQQPRLGRRPDLIQRGQNGLKLLLGVRIGHIDKHQQQARKDGFFEG